MRRFSFVILIFAFAALSPAPIRHKSGDPGRPIPEASNAELRSFQTHQATMAEVGQVPMHTRTDEPYVPMADPAGAKIISHTDLPREEDVQAVAVLKAAEDEIRNAELTRRRLFTGLIALLILVVGGGFGLKKYVDKAIPYRPLRRRSRV